MAKVVSIGIKAFLHAPLVTQRGASVWMQWRAEFVSGGPWRWIGPTLPNGVTPVVVDEGIPGRATEYLPSARTVSHRWELPPVSTLAAAKDIAVDLAFEVDPTSVYQTVKA